MSYKLVKTSEVEPLRSDGINFKRSKVSGGGGRKMQRLSLFGGIYRLLTNKFLYFLMKEYNIIIEKINELL
jgi:hypothetical protein